MVAKSFPRKRVRTKNFQQLFIKNIFHGRKIISSKKCPYQKFSLKIFWSIIFCRIFLWSQNHFLENGSVQKSFIKNFLFKNFFWSKNHFLENGYVPKILLKNFFVENFFWSQDHFLENGSVIKIFNKRFLIRN